MKIEETNKIRFCERYSNIKEISLENNKRIIDKLVDENIKKICWIGDEAINYPNIIDLITYAKEKNIECEFLFNNIWNCNLKKIKDMIKYIDVITLTSNLIDENFNYIYNVIQDFKNKAKINILTMLNAENIEEKDKMKERIETIRINTWIILGFMPMLLNLQDDIEKLKLSKINLIEFWSSNIILNHKIEHIYKLTDYSIVRDYNIILPNGDIAVMNDKDSYIIGNILKDSKDRIEKNYKNKRKYLIPKKNDQKVKIIVALNDKKIADEIIKEIKPLKYVDIVGITTSGKETLKEILKKQPDMVFLQYNFKDLPGYNLIVEVGQKLHMESPVFNIYTNDIIEDELYAMIRDKYIKLNGYIHENHYEGRFLDIVEQFKEYRDKS